MELSVDWELFRDYLERVRAYTRQKKKKTSSVRTNISSALPAGVVRVALPMMSCTVGKNISVESYSDGMFLVR